MTTVAAPIISRQDLEADAAYLLLGSYAVTAYHLHLMEELRERNVKKSNGKEFRDAMKIVSVGLKSRIDRNVPDVLGIGSDQQFYKISDSIEDLVIEVATLKPDFIPVIVQMMRLFKQEPQKMLDFLELNIVDEL